MNFSSDASSVVSSDHSRWVVVGSWDAIKIWGVNRMALALPDASSTRYDLLSSPQRSVYDAQQQRIALALVGEVRGLLEPYPHSQERREYLRQLDDLNETLQQQLGRVQQYIRRLEGLRDEIQADLSQLASLGVRSIQ